MTPVEGLKIKLKKKRRLKWLIMVIKLIIVITYVLLCIAFCRLTLDVWSEYQDIQGDNSRQHIEEMERLGN